jgi:hypothetical protein
MNGILAMPLKHPIMNLALKVIPIIRRIPIYKNYMI